MNRTLWEKHQVTFTEEVTLALSLAFSTGKERTGANLFLVNDLQLIEYHQMSLSLGAM